MKIIKKLICCLTDAIAPCDNCYKGLTVGWYASDELWQEVTGGDYDVLCINCFDKLAENDEFYIQWVPAKEHFIYATENSMKYDFFQSNGWKDK